MSTRILKLDMLVRLGACEEQLDKFKAIFGDQMEVSVERASQSDVIDAGFDFCWVAENLLSTEEFGEYQLELNSRLSVLKAKYEVCWYTDLPPTERRRLKSTLVAEFYVKSTYVPPFEEPWVEGAVRETPVEESLGGY